MSSAEVHCSSWYLLDVREDVDALKLGREFERTFSGCSCCASRKVERRVEAKRAVRESTGKL